MDVHRHTCRDRVCTRNVARFSLPFRRVVARKGTVPVVVTLKVCARDPADLRRPPVTRVLSPFAQANTSIELSRSFDRTRV
jgi:hypothetical protein